MGQGQGKSKRGKETASSSASSNVTSPAKSPKSATDSLPDVLLPLNSQRTGCQPTVIRWNATPTAMPSNVKVTGSFNSWEKGGLPLQQSGEDFWIVLQLEKGEHHFKFVVDGQSKVDQKQPTKTTQGHGICNVVTVSDSPPLATSEDSLIFAKTAEVYSDEGWGTPEDDFKEDRKNPPACPPHLRFTPLNSQAQVRTFSSVHHPTAAEIYSADPCQLPVPLLATVGHSYYQRREGFLLVGTTQRYKEKYTTLVMYKPTESGGGLMTQLPPSPGGGATTPTNPEQQSNTTSEHHTQPLAVPTNNADATV
eukprot:TRINITY_DN54356_c0_g1_i1.p1 TRINITY_DN54356_c0_g1~~TRINITY_DN54356_c0_g1_i1.p1  ORF type:complete len:308 (+),score=43.89 TRINITY_DN54356_c0_g1_i1:24-947(+)